MGGKTGTSEDGVNTNKYVTSFIGLAGKDEPQIAIIVILYNPTGEGGHQGGAVAAPIASQILGEVLPYITENEEKEYSIEMPEITGLDIGEAKKIIENLGLEYEIIGEENECVTDQLPKKGIKISEGTKITIYR